MPVGYVHMLLHSFQTFVVCVLEYQACNQAWLFFQFVELIVFLLVVIAMVH